MKINFKIHCRLFLLGVLLSGCSSSHVIQYREEVSRDFTDISFSKNQAPFCIRTIVGGEHVSSYTVLGFEGEVYVVKLTSLVGEAYHTISGDGIQITQKNPKESNRACIRILDKETMFTIRISSHPYAEYELLIQKI